MLKVLLALIMLTSPALAGACGVRSNVVYRQAIVAQQYYAPAAVVLQQAAPYTYWTVGQSVQENSQLAVYRAENLKIIREEFQQLRKELLRSNVPADPEAQKALGLQVLEQNCSKCHTVGSKAVVDKEAPVFWDADKNFVATPEQMGGIKVAVKNGIMPPTPAQPLSDDDYLAIKQFLTNGGK